MENVEKKPIFSVIPNEIWRFKKKKRKNKEKDIWNNNTERVGIHAKAPQVASGLTSIYYLFLLIWPILLEEYSAQTYPKITQKFANYPATQIHGMMKEFLDCLKSERDISIKPCQVAEKWRLGVFPLKGAVSPIFLLLWIAKKHIWIDGIVKIMVQFC